MRSCWSGRAAEPSVLVIDDDRVRLEPAGDLWGARAVTTEAPAARATGRRLSDRHDRPGRRAAGPLRHDLARRPTRRPRRQRRGAGREEHQGHRRARHAALPVGAARTNWCSWPSELSERSFGPATAKYRELGTATNLLVFNRLGVLPTRNFQQGTFARAAQISRRSNSA